MSKNVDFEIGTIVTDTFLDSVQELLTGTSQNIRLAESTLGTDRIALALNGDTMFDNRGSVNVEGRYCFIDMVQDSSPAVTGNGVKNVYLSTTANGTPQQPNFSITVDNSPPPASYLKRIGEVTLTGGQLSDAKMITGVQADHEQYNHFTFRSVFNLADETLISVEGQSNQASTAGVTYDSDVSSAPTKAISVGENGNERLYLDTAGRVVFVDDGTGDGDAALQVGYHGAETIITTGTELSSHIPGTNGGAGFSSFSTRAIDVDTANRVQISNTGVICWGDGTLAPDVCLSRVGPDQLSLATGDQLYMDYTITNLDTGDLVTNKEYVDAQDVAVLSTAKRFAFFIGR